MRAHDEVHGPELLDPCDVLERFPVDTSPDEGSIPGYLPIVKGLIEVEVEFDTGDLELVCEENLGGQAGGVDLFVFKIIECDG